MLAGDPPDFALIGIGENGHLAFNDPHVADFDDPVAVKVVELDEDCRRQQVHDGAFATFDDAPKRALTLTLPRIMSATRIFIVVPGSRKRAAVEAALHGPVAVRCPASTLRTHPQARLFLDVASASDTARIVT
jgi:glucosamine-6-phosphate deaminase